MVPRQRLIVMLKVPRPGKVKTRLARDIGAIDAVWWFRHQTRQVLHRLRDPRWDLVLAVAPDAEGLRSRVWPDDLPRIAQGRGDLGQRMARVMQGPGAVCVIGGDIPCIQRHHIAKAFNALGSKDAVFGPSDDGGYWLVGLSGCRPPPLGFFHNVRWSSEHALGDSIRSLGDRCVGLVDQLQDVDDATDLARLQAATERFLQ